MTAPSWPGRQRGPGPAPAHELVGGWALGLVHEMKPRAALMRRAMALGYQRAMLAVVLDHDDAHEGCQAFLDKRRPRFSGA